MVTVGVLGPLAVSRDGRSIAVRDAATAVVLSVLAAAGGPVAPARLDDVLALVVGGDAGRRGAVPSTVWRLRRLLGPETVVSDGGYLLDHDHCQTDIARFEALLDRAEAAADPEEAFVLRGEALALWRGNALPLLAADPEGTATARRLGQRRAAAAAASAAFREDRIREGI